MQYVRTTEQVTMMTITGIFASNRLSLNENPDDYTWCLSGECFRVPLNDDQKNSVEEKQLFVNVLPYSSRPSL